MKHDTSWSANSCASQFPKPSGGAMSAMEGGNRHGGSGY